MPEEERCGFVLEPGAEETLFDVISPVRNRIAFADFDLPRRRDNWLRCVASGDHVARA